MKIKTIAAFACLLLSLLAHFTKSHAQISAPGHAFIYKATGLGLVTPGGQSITEPKYVAVNQVNLFLVAEEITPFGYPSEQAVPLDLYNAWGKFIQQAGGFFPVNDSTLLTYSWSLHGRLIRFVFPYNARFLASETSNKALGGLAYPRATLVYASGRTVNLDFGLVSYPLPGNKFIVAKHGKQGLYDADRDKMMLPLQYDTVMYKPDSFFLGWNSEADHKLIDINGREYKSPAIVYQAGRINNTGTIFGVGLGVNSWFYSSYNSKGKLISEVSQFEPGMDCVIGYENIEAPYNYYKIAYRRWNNVRSYLLDAEGKPLLAPRDNPDSIVVPAGGDLFFTAKHPRSGPDDGTLYYTGLFNAADRKLIAKENDSTSIVVTRKLVYVKKGDKNYYYDPHGRLIAVTANVSAAKKQAGPGVYYRYNRISYQTGLEQDEVHAFETFTNLQDTSENLSSKGDATDELPFLVGGKAYLKGPQGGYVVPGENGKDYVFEDFATLKIFPQADVNTRFCLGRVGGKWGVYEVDPLRQSGDKDFPDVVQRVKMVAAPEYEEITVCRTGWNVLFCLRSKDRKIWIDTAGEVLAGGKSFDFVGFSALPDGRRLAFALDGDNTGQTLHSTPYITKVMMIDAAGNVLHEMKINIKQKITPGAVFIVDEDRILTGNTLYELGTGKKIPLPVASSDSKPRVIQMKGRAVAATFHWQTSTKPGLFTKGGTSYPYETFHIKTGRKIGTDGPGYVPFFDDAIKLEGGAIITGNGDLYN